MDGAESLSLDLSSLQAGFRRGELTAAAVVEEVLRRIAAAGDDKVWIARVPDEVLRARAAALDAERRSAGWDDLQKRRPLFGIPFGVKDNIDVAGLPTTAACAAFAYEPHATAHAVARLEEAGAIVIGKTNLDQFATGLVGTRSPYGVPRNPFDARFIPGGSSSGSAVAVAAGLVSFTLGTDTAGSGRVPAAFNNIVGLKPSRGLISTQGVVPACRSLDCVSIFALGCEDAAAVLDICRGFDRADAFSRRAPANAGRAFTTPFRFAVPRAADLDFFGDPETPRLFAEAARKLELAGGVRIEADFAPFRAAGDLLYGGPWLAERRLSIEAFLAARAETLLPLTRQIIAGGERYSATDTFRALHRLAALRREAEALWDHADVLLLPTAGTTYTIAAIEADPIELNIKLGRYTTFANLLDLAAVALPAGFRADGLPFGISLIGPAFSDDYLSALGSVVAAQLGLPLGATNHRLAAATKPAPRMAAGDMVEIAVVGAHLSGMALNRELTERGARLSRAARTEPLYRLFLLDVAGPPRPGLVRYSEGGAAIDVEIWQLSLPAFGAFVAAVPSPLAIGTLLLDNGSAVKGFLCEAEAVRNARDISAYGGWRRFVAETAR